MTSYQIDEFLKAKSGNTVSLDNDYNKLDKSTFCDCHKNLFDVEIKRGKYDGMWLLKKKNNLGFLLITI